MKRSAKAGGWPHDGIDLSDLHNHIYANREKPARIKPAPVIDECATCHRKDTLRPADGDERKRREWLCEKCGCVATEGDLDNPRDSDDNGPPLA